MTFFIRFNFLVLLAFYLGDFCSGVVVSIDPNYTQWPQGRIFYYFNTQEYSQQEQAWITQAMQTFSANTGGCIQFQQLNAQPPAGTPNVVIINKNGNPQSAPSPTCYSNPGMIRQLNGQYQYMCIRGGTSGCLTSAQSVMRLLATLVGLRSEHNKCCRNQFITVNQNNVDQQAQLYSPFNILNTSSVLNDCPNFDYNSITCLGPRDLSGNGQPVLQSLSSTPVSNNGALSMRDCQTITSLYQAQGNQNCQPQTCTDPYGAGGLSATTLSALVSAVNGGAGGASQFANNCQIQSGLVPNAQFPNGQFPNGLLPNGQSQPNAQFPNAQFPNGLLPNGQSQPNGLLPNAQVQNGIPVTNQNGQIPQNGLIPNTPVQNGIPVTNQNGQIPQNGLIPNTPVQNGIPVANQITNPNSVIQQPTNPVSPFITNPQQNQIPQTINSPFSQSPTTNPFSGLQQPTNPQISPFITNPQQNQIPQAINSPFSQSPTNPFSGLQQPTNPQQNPQTITNPFNLNPINPFSNIANNQIIPSNTNPINSNPSGITGGSDLG